MQKRRVDNLTIWADNKADYEMLETLIPFASYWTERLGLGDVPIDLSVAVREDVPPDRLWAKQRMLVANGDSVQIKIRESYWRPPRINSDWLSRLKKRRFEVIEIRFQGTTLELLRQNWSRPCWKCEREDHTSSEHAMLHELVHLAFPKRALDNPWTDRKVKLLLACWRGS